MRNLDLQQCQSLPDFIVQLAVPSVAGAVVPIVAVQTVSSASSALRIASLLNSDGTKYAAYILGTGGVRLVKLSEVTIK